MASVVTPQRHPRVAHSEEGIVRGMLYGVRRVVTLFPSRLELSERCASLHSSGDENSSYWVDLDRQIL
jgi:hypothetical protein